MNRMGVEDMVFDEVMNRLVERQVLEICYDREACQFLGVDYCRINSDEMKKIRSYVIENYFTGSDSHNSENFRAA